MKNLSLKSIIANIIFFLIILSLGLSFKNSLKWGYDKESFQITEFLINYHGGFVRRGLLGEAIINTYYLTGINPYKIILFISFSSYLLLIWFYVKGFIKNGYTLFILPFVFFLGNPINNDFLIRKDVLIMVIFILIMYYSTRKSIWSIIQMNLVLIIGLLIHEGIGFFCLPILFLILYSKNTISSTTDNYSIKSTITPFFQTLPSILTFLCTLHFKGTQNISLRIWNSWKNIPFPIQSKVESPIPSAIAGLSWTLKNELDFMKNCLYHCFNDNIYAPIAWLITLLVVFHILTNTSKLNFKILNYYPNSNFNKLNISNILVFQLLAITPLFIIASDYGRWVFYWVASSFAIILIIPEKEISGFFPKYIYSISTRLNYITESIFGKSSILLLCLLIGFPNYSWSIGSALDSSSLIMILRFISKIFQQLFHLLLLN